MKAHEVLPLVHRQAALVKRWLHIAEPLRPTRSRHLRLALGRLTVHRHLTRKSPSGNLAVRSREDQSCVRSPQMLLQPPTAPSGKRKRAFHPPGARQAVRACDAPAREPRPWMLG